MQLTLGLDIGTSATKAILIDDRGAVFASCTESYDYDKPKPAWTEQDPEVWWQATTKCMQSLAAIAAEKQATIIAVGFSGQMHGSVLLGEEHTNSGGQAAGALRPALLWNDQRTGKQCEEIERLMGGRHNLVERVGNAALTGFTLPKLLWIRQNESETFSRATAFMLPKDYIRFRLTGEIASDVGDAAGTLLLDVDKRSWSDEVARAVGIDPAILPPLLESCQIAGCVTPWAATQTGLEAGTPIAAGSGDNMMGAIGAGVVKPGMALATLGTSGVLYAHAETPAKDTSDPNAPGRLHTMCAADGAENKRGGWCMTGCMLSAAGSFQWARDNLFPSASFGDLVAEAESAPPGCEGLVFLPYLTGERCPYPDPNARGGWIGLTSRHKRAHLVRSILEGVGFGMGQIMNLMRACNVSPQTVRIGGGGARSTLWRQITADALDAPIVSTNADEGPAFGAALLAGTAVGVWPDIAAACEQTIATTETIEPDPASQSGTRDIAVVYAQLYSDLRPRFEQLSAHAANTQ